MEGRRNARNISNDNRSRHVQYVVQLEEEINVLRELRKSAKRSRPALIPSRERGATYGRKAELHVPFVNDDLWHRPSSINLWSSICGVGGSVE
jgi:hypothetical protein